MLHRAGFLIILLAGALPAQDPGVDKPEVALNLLHLGRTYLSRVRFADAAQVLARALALAREFGDQRLEGEVLIGLGELARVRGRYTEAESFYQRAKDLAAGVDGTESSGMAASLYGLATVYKQLGRYAEARQKAERFARRYPQSFLAPSVEAAIAAIPG